MLRTDTWLQLLAVATVGSAVMHRSPLDVQLVPFNDTTITAVITNTDEKGYNLLHRNSILDLDPSRKLHISSHVNADMPFRGLQKHGCAHGAHGGPSKDDFTAIEAGQTLYRDIDVAEMYDLDTELYDIFAGGSLPYADDNRVWLSGNSVPFSSNVLKLPVTVAQARTSSMTNSQFAIKRKRTTIKSDCSSDQATAITNANEGCVALANAAADAAGSGSAEMFQKYFKDSSESTRNKVAKVFRAVAKECAATPGGTSTSQCTDPYSYCSGNLIAYTYWSTGDGSEPVRDVYYCPRYFDVMPAESTMCHSQSQATNTLHEMTHALAATDDYAYGMDAIMGLSSEQAVANADTYALYATDLDLQCGSGGVSSDWGAQDSPPSDQDDTTNTWAEAPSGSSGQSTQNDGWEETPDGSSDDGTSNESSYSWDDLLAWFKNYRSA